MSQYVHFEHVSIDVVFDFMAGGIKFDDTQVSNAWLADSDNGATAMDMTGSDQVRRQHVYRVGGRLVQGLPGCAHLAWTDMGINLSE